MNESIFCIGLNVGGDEPSHQLTETLHELTYLVEVKALALGVGVWGGCGERMLHVRAAHITNDADTVAAILAHYLRQECVAVLNGDGKSWRLVDANGIIAPGGHTSEFPVLPGISCRAPK